MFFSDLFVIKTTSFYMNNRTTLSVCSCYENLYKIGQRVQFNSCCRQHLLPSIDFFPNINMKLLVTKQRVVVHYNCFCCPIPSLSDST